MKILKHGVKKEDKTYKRTCGDCRCKIEVSGKEIKCENDRNDVYYYVKCPECKAYIYFNNL